MAQQALHNSNEALAAIERHTIECAENYRGLRRDQEGVKYIGKIILSVLAGGTLLLLGGIGAIAYALFQFIIRNPKLFQLGLG